MNHFQLKERYAKIYEEFLSRYPITAAASCSFSFFGEYAAPFGALCLIQPIQLYVLCGLKEGVGVECEEFICMDERGRKFEKREPNSLLSSLLKKLFEYLNVKDVKVGILCEAPPHCGLNTSSAFSVAFALCFLKKEGLLKEEDTRRWKEIKKSQLQNDRVWDKVFRFAWKIDSCIHGHIHSGAEVFASLSGSSGAPLLYFCERRKEFDLSQISHNGLSFVDVTDFSSYSVYDDLKYFCIGLDELLPRSFPPVHIALVYTGESLSSYEVMERMRAQIQSWQRTEQFFYRFFHLFPQEVDFLNTDEKLLPSLYQTLSAISLRTLRSYTRCVNRGRANEFIESINTYRNVLSALGLLAQRVSSFYEQVREHTLCGIKPAGTCMVGDALLVYPKSVGKRLIETLKEKMQVVTHYATEEEDPLSSEGAHFIKAEEPIKVKATLGAIYVSGGVLRGREAKILGHIILRKMMGGTKIHWSEGYFLFDDWSPKKPKSSFSLIVSRINKAAGKKVLKAGKDGYYFITDSFELEEELKPLKSVFSANLKDVGEKEKELLEKAAIFDPENLYILKLLVTEDEQRRKYASTLIRKIRRYTNGLRFLKTLLKKEEVSEEEVKVKEKELFLMKEEYKNVKKYLREDECVRMIKKIKKGDEKAFFKLLAHENMKKILKMYGEEAKTWLWELLKEMDANKIKNEASIFSYLRKTLKRIKSKN